MAHALVPGSDWLGQESLEVIQEDCCPYLIERIMCFPSPVIISPTVSTFRYFRHLLMAMSSRLGNCLLRKRSIRNLSLLVTVSRGGE